VQASTNLACSPWFPLQTVTLTNGSYHFSDPLPSNVVSRFYSLGLPCAQCGGTLEGMIGPSNAVNLGAQWQVDGGAWQGSGTLVELPAGIHIVQFGNIAGWNPPTNQILTITNGFVTLATGTYTPQGGTLQVTITPPEAVSAGAEWQVDGGVWETSGATVALPPGPHNIQFTNLAGWNTPSNQIVTITNEIATAAMGIYTLAVFDGFTGAVNAGAVTLTGYSGPDGTVTIPSAINGLPVTSIGQGLFQNDPNLISITIPACVTNLGHGAFSNCPNLASVFFYGNAPAVDASVFSGDTNAVGYYLPGTTGWYQLSSVTGLRTTEWMPQLQSSSVGFAPRSAQFGFNITWANNMQVGVESCANFARSNWTRLATVTLTNGSFYFSDPASTNSSWQFYRLVWP